MLARDNSMRAQVWGVRAVAKLCLIQDIDGRPGSSAIATISLQVVIRLGVGSRSGTCR